MKPATMTPMYAVIYARMAEAARSCGYALAVHGSMSRDLDVVAIPWVESATSADEVVRAMASIAARRIGDDLVIGYQMSNAPRPHGRVGYSFPFQSSDGAEPDGYVDVSVMPRVPSPTENTGGGRNVSAIHYVTPLERRTTPLCGRAVLAHVRATSNWREVTCKWCLRLKPPDARPSSGDAPKETP